MSDNHFKWLEADPGATTCAGGSGSSGTHPPLDQACTRRLREQLVAEIQQLEAELAALQERGEKVEFSLQQTCREMIHSRQQLFLKLRQ